ncbi:NRPS-like enzyme [Guyanagaster necrorhizus]|uniref:NRPS-like enzyme n=1 Tax=Guyanagaster necrorhizus TaxID=856835 RepID=A0A9P7VPX5_9AGAR|nr:NRPS-like enzyme [Guyanagaster necrorhizus MCA 3950]KAG7444602.1 NRPS-like enzyme [Guyanagaster necrorhizus MCA 3950]
MSLPAPQGVSSSTFNPPPLDGSLTPPELFDYNGCHSAKHSLFRYDDSDDGKFRSITWEEGIAAFHVAGHYFREHINDESPAIVGILVNTDSITYFTVLVGLMRLGKIPFPISTRNSVAAIIHLMKSTNSKYLVVSGDATLQKLADIVYRHFRESVADEGIITIPMPCFADLYSSKARSYQPLAPIRPEWSQTAIVLHSSDYGEIDLCGEVVGAQAVPMYHTMGFSSILLSVGTGAIIACFPPIEPPMVPTAERLLSSVINTRSTIIFSVPSFLENWARDSRAIEALKSTTAITFAGGPLEKTAGDTLAANGIFIVSVFGLTESAVSMVLPKSIPAEGCEWMRMPSNIDVAFVPTDEEGIYHLYENGLNSPSVLDTEIDGVKAFDTKDLVQLHPLNRNLFKIPDDQIIHNTGEKTNPVPIEACLVADRRIAAAVMFGRSKFQPGVLIQPTPYEAFDSSDVIRLAEYRTKIWATINKANEQAPQHSRIYKEMILIAKPTKPFEFTAKGTPRRSAILKTYKEEIEALYKTLDHLFPADVVIPQVWSLKNITTMIRDIVRAVFERDVNDTDDIFVAGGDSLTAMAIRNSILRALRESDAVSVKAVRALPHNFVFDSPSVAELSTFIYGFVLDTQATTTPQDTSNGLSTVPSDKPRHEQSFTDQSQSVMKLRDGNGESPLIIIPGADGSFFEYVTYADTFRTAVWTLAFTPDTPLTSLHDMAFFYFSKIKADRPTGPYRFASYSSTSVLLIVLLKLFEDNGDEIAQAVMLDHFPAMLVYAANKHGNPDPGVPENVEMMLDASMVSIKAMMDRDSHRKQRLWDTVGTNDLDMVCRSIRNIRAYLTAAAEFVYKLSTDKEGVSSIELMAQWLRTVKAPVTVVVAAKGAAYGTEWPDMGTRQCLPDARVVVVPGGHYEFLRDEVIVELLQEGY